MTALLETPLPTTPESAPPPTPKRRRPGPDFWIVCGLLLAVLAVQGWNITGFPVVSDDEGTYLAQAQAVQHGTGLAHYTYWYDHPPVGWIQLALVSWLPAQFTPGDLLTAQMRVAMLPVTAVSAVMLYLIGRRLRLPRWAAALAVLLFGLSPLSVTLQRELFLDNFAVMWMLVAFALALSPRQHLWHHVGAGLAVGMAVLSKETMVIVLPALLVALWQGAHRATRKYSLVGFATALFLLCAQYPLYAALKDELLPGRGHVSLVDGVLFQMRRAGSGSVFTDGSGSNLVLRSWLYYDAVLIVGGLAAAVLLLASRRLRAPALACLLLAAVSMRPSGYLPAMYTVQALPFLALALAGLAFLAVEFLLRSRRDGTARPAPVARRCAVAVLALLAAGYVVPQWYEGDRRALVTPANAQYRAAARWIDREVPDPAHTRILVDDALWPDLVRDGFRPRTGAIWFYKVDLDPAVAKTLPRGWRDVDYVVSTPTVRQNRNSLPTVRAALSQSRVRAVFGSGEDRIEIRQVVKGPQEKG